MSDAIIASVSRRLQTEGDFWQVEPVTVGICLAVTLEGKLTLRRFAAHFPNSKTRGQCIMVVDILLNTPAWVYAVFALLLWLGVCQLRVRPVSIHRIWLTPMVFIVWGLLGLIRHSTGGLMGMSPWLIAAAAGVCAGSLRPNTLVIDHARGMVMRRASFQPLLRNIMVFAAHYALNIAAAFHPGRHEIIQIDMAISGVFAGYFLGWLMRFYGHYRASAGVADEPAVVNP